MGRGSTPGKGRGNNAGGPRPTGNSSRNKKNKKKGSQDVENTRKFYKPKMKQAEDLHVPTSEETRLNKFIANAGKCSRREADDHIKAGLVAVNNKVITEMGYKVQPGDTVKYNGETIKGEKKVYLLLNKPKGFITTMYDEKARKTVMDLVGGACRERIYPVGRLDRATTGVLLFTNDGELAQKLTHPSQGARKIYMASLDKNMKASDLVRLTEGITLDDGVAIANEAAFVEGKGKKTIGLEIHMGRNRVVRKMFETMGYEVTKLDRSIFAGLTKKNLQRGQWRFLSAEEVKFLKMK